MLPEFSFDLLSDSKNQFFKNHAERTALYIVNNVPKESTRNQKNKEV